MSSLFIIFLQVLGVLSWQDANLPRRLSSFAVSHPGFLTLAVNSTADYPIDGINLIISRFNGFPFSTDYVSMVRTIGRFVQQSRKPVVVDLTKQPVWPNEAKGIPDEVFKRANMVVIPSGFLVPTKTNGGLTIMDLNLDSPTPHTITKKDESWFYHRVIWMDMDSDGLLDAVTCRAQKPLLGSTTKGELLWYKHPDVLSPWKYIWQENILAQGEGAPDVFLISAHLQGPGGSILQTIVTPGFFSKSVDIWWRKNEKQPWSEANIQRRTVDNTQGPAFDVVVTDVNFDKHDDLLVTYNKPNNGSLVAYQLPGDFSSGNFIRHIIANGFNAATGGIGKGAPGSVKVFKPNSGSPPGKPFLLISGDDNGSIYIYTATNSTNVTDWRYDAHLLEDDGDGTVGQMAVGDVDGDGWTEIFVPAYNKGIVTAYTYKPKL